MHATTIAVDLGKQVFEIAIADDSWRVTERQRLSRSRFARFFVDRSPCQTSAPSSLFPLINVAPCRIGLGPFVLGSTLPSQ
jgi:hypothetical protein